MKDRNGIKNLNEPAWMARSVKPQTVRNTLGLGGGRCGYGKLPQGGFQGMWVFDDTEDYKNSPTTKPEPQNRIISRGK
jgi:hypothetical protein